MLDAAITGSFKIWRKYAQRTERDAIGEGEEEGIIEQKRGRWKWRKTREREKLEESKGVK
jgi:hypothetical protein